MLGIMVGMDRRTVFSSTTFFGRLPFARRRPGGALDGQQSLVVEGSPVPESPGVFTPR